MRSAVIELDTECMRPNDLDTMHAMDGMAHASSYSSGIPGSYTVPAPESNEL